MIKNKYKEAHSRIQKYQEYIELLSKLGSEKYAWVPTPKVLVSKVMKREFLELFKTILGAKIGEFSE